MLQNVPPLPPFEIQRSQTAHGVWLHLCGELDIAVAAEAEAAITSAATLRKRVIVDLRGLDFIDSSGLALLVRCHDHATQDGFELQLVRGGGTVTRALEICGLERYFSFVEAPESLPAETA